MERRCTYPGPNTGSHTAAHPYSDKGFAYPVFVSHELHAANVLLLDRLFVLGLLYEIAVSETFTKVPECFFEFMSTT